MGTDRAERSFLARDLFALDVGTNSYSLPPTAPPPEADQNVALSVTEEESAPTPRARVLLANFAGLAEADVSATAVSVRRRLMLSNPVDLSPSPSFLIQADIATATRAPNGAVFTTNWQTPRVTALGDTAEPIAVTSNLFDFWVLTQSAQGAGLSRFATHTAAPLGEVNLGPVEAVAVDGGVGAGENNATPGGVVVATVTTPGKGQLVTFRGGNPSDPGPLVINLDGQPQAMSVVELAIGGSPVQYAWVTLMTPRRAVVECYNLATLQRTISIDIGAVNAVDMTVGLADGTSSDDDDEEGRTGFVQVLAIE